MAAAVLGSSGVAAQGVQDDRHRGVQILRDIKRELRLWYYDPDFGGRDLDAMFTRSEQRVQAATSQAQISAAIAQVLMALNDSHTFFIPPPLAYEVDYGFEMGMVGSTCHVMAVKPGTLAEEDGVTPGMAIRTIEGIAPTRENLWTIRYALNAVRPRKELRLAVEGSRGGPRMLTVRGQVSPPRPYQGIENWSAELGEKLRVRNGGGLRSVLLGDRVLVAKLSTFMVPEEQTNRMLKDAHGREALILDLRHNGGGPLDVVKRVAGAFVEGDLKIADMKERKRTRPVTTDRTPANRQCAGKLIVLVDAESASASEVLARALQIHKRATIVGDRTAGAVMLARFHSYSQGHEARFLIYGLSITEADLVMTDGRSLEKQGVTPDELVLPSAEDLAAGRDPVLARAAALAGIELTPEAAGKLFPWVWE